MLIRRLFFPTFLFILGAFPIYLKAQIPGSLDLSFDPGSGVNSITAEVNESLQLPDGKIMAVGYFSSFGGSTEMNRIAKLNSDGTPASGFISGVTAPSLTNSSFRMYCLALQDDGKVLIGGNFTNYNGYIRNKIARINQDGTIDLSFDPGSGFSNTLSSIKDIKIQQDGKILVAGDFTSYNGTNYSGIIRLNQDGSLDTSFIPQTGIYQFQINSVDIQADGKIIAGGPFAYIGTTNVRIVRFNIDGTIDPTFNPNANGSATNINKILIQPDGKVIIAGMFSSMNGNQSIKNITRVDTNGNIDAGFLVGSDPQGMIYDLHLDPNGKIVVVGSFTIWNSITAHRILRLNSNGTFDSSFNSGDGANNAINCVTNQADGKYLIGGAYSQYDNTSRKGFARLNSNGTNAVQDNQFTQFSVYPNPFKEIIEIKSESVFQNILITDITGKIVYSNYGAPSFTVNTSEWLKGIYLIKKENQTVKIIKE
jgi:uncharacterized delta-60 repeat protein